MIRLISQKDSMAKTNTTWYHLHVEPKRNTQKNELLETESRKELKEIRRGW